MARYMEVVKELSKAVDSLVEDAKLTPAQIRQLGYIVNLAVRSHPRPAQSTIRKNIVEGAVGKYCLIHMEKVTDEKTGNEFNRISIRERT